MKISRNKIFQFFTTHYKLHKTIQYLWLDLLIVTKNKNWMVENKTVFMFPISIKNSVCVMPFFGYHSKSWILAFIYVSSIPHRSPVIALNLPVNSNCFDLHLDKRSSRTRFLWASVQWSNCKYISQKCYNEYSFDLSFDIYIS